MEEREQDWDNDAAKYGPEEEWVQVVEPIVIDAVLAKQVRQRADELDMSMQEYIERAIKLALSIKTRESMPLGCDPDDYPLY